MPTQSIELFISSTFLYKMLQLLHKFPIILFGSLEQVKAALGVESSVPKLLVVLCVSVAPVSHRMIFINKWIWWLDHSICRWAVKCRNCDAGCIVVHNCPVEHNLVSTVAKNLQLQARDPILQQNWDDIGVSVSWQSKGELKLRAWSMVVYGHMLLMATWCLV